jgi:hypothetical protein
MYSIGLLSNKILRFRSYSGFWWCLRFGLIRRKGFEASERNKDASHAPTACKLALYAFHTIRVAAFLARASPNRVLKTKRGGGGERR